uniref:50S ribosomal protein L9 n=1 Tax=Microzonia abyssicola TaxID=217214 RepID=UPI002E76F562|nr:50S ribosomal protein L9 [Syringoderma abyssicola]WAM65087.1 50S ribosomal protein L9 [Syringoderma abyssicola]
MRKKIIQVILTQDVQKLGKQGSIVKVKPGYIRNYLIPLKLGKIATPKLVKQFNLQQKEVLIKQNQFMEKCISIKELLENLEKFTIKKKVAKNGKFFGKITKKQILKLIQNKVGTIEITKNQLQIPEIKQLGEYIINIILTKNVIAEIIIKILPE